MMKYSDNLKCKSITKSNLVTVSGKCDENRTKLKISQTRITFSRSDLLKLMKYGKIRKTISLPNSVLSLIWSKAGGNLAYLSNKIKENPRFSQNKVCNGQGMKWQSKPELVHHANGYVPPQMRPKCDTNDLLLFQKAINGLLNKLTPENFQTCLADILKLNINSEEKLNCLVEQIFTKAIQSECYSKLYSTLVSKFNILKVKGKTFTNMLITKCQQMFKKGLDKEIDEVKKYWADKIEAEQDERMKTMYQESIEEKINKVKDQYSGNIRFIAELYLQKEIPSKIIVFLIDNMLGKVNDCTAMESVCLMLTIVGKDLEPRNPKEMDQFFIKIQELSVCKELNTKTRFKFKDLIDMRNRKWELRQIQMIKNVVPKTLKDIHKQ